MCNSGAILRTARKLKHRQRILLTLFNWHKLLIQHTLPSFWGMMNEGEAHSLTCCSAKTPMLTRWLSSVLKVFKWIRGTRYCLECTGLLDQCQCVTFYVDKLQEFHQTSCHFPVALKANLLFDVHLDKWVLSQSHLHLSFHTWRPESKSWSIWANLHRQAHFRLGCGTCLPWHQICSNPNL